MTTVKYVPRWFPGTYFHKVANRMRDVTHELRYAPMKEIKAGIVSTSQ
jgi:hypothetical protein